MLIFIFNYPMLFYLTIPIYTKYHNLHMNVCSIEFKEFYSEIGLIVLELIRVKDIKDLQEDILHKSKLSY